MATLEEKNTVEYWQGCLNRANGDVFAIMLIQGKINSLIRDKPNLLNPYTHNIE